MCGQNRLALCTWQCLHGSRRASQPQAVGHSHCLRLKHRFVVALTVGAGQPQVTTRCRGCNISFASEKCYILVCTKRCSSVWQAVPGHCNCSCIYAPNSVDRVIRGMLNRYYACAHGLSSLAERRSSVIDTTYNDSVGSDNRRRGRCCAHLSVCVVPPLGCARPPRMSTGDPFALITFRFALQDRSNSTTRQHINIALNGIIAHLSKPHARKSTLLGSEHFLLRQHDKKAFVDHENNGFLFTRVCIARRVRTDEVVGRPPQRR